MKWSRLEIEYEGFPLLIRRPDHKDIWQYKGKFTRLVSVEHSLEQVRADGLPEPKYNASLSEFDHFMCSLFPRNTNGIILLVETFAGKRNYYYYTEPEFDMVKTIDRVKKKFPVLVSVNIRTDIDWGFIDAYPVDLYRG